MRSNRSPQVPLEALAHLRVKTIIEITLLAALVIGGCFLLSHKLPLLRAQYQLKNSPDTVMADVANEYWVSRNKGSQTTDHFTVRYTATVAQGQLSGQGFLHEKPVEGQHVKVWYDRNTLISSMDPAGDYSTELTITGILALIPAAFLILVVIKGLKLRSIARVMAERQRPAA